MRKWINIVEGHDNRVKLYHGGSRDPHDNMFLTTDRGFAFTYGHVYEYLVDLGDVCDTTDATVAQSLLPLFDPYDDTDIETLDQYMERVSDTWEMVEDSLHKVRGDSVLITEGGYTNYLVFDAARIELMSETPIASRFNEAVAETLVIDLPMLEARGIKKLLDRCVNHALGGLAYREERVPLRRRYVVRGDAKIVGVLRDHLAQYGIVSSETLTEGVREEFFYHVMSVEKAAHVAKTDTMEARWEHEIDGRRVKGNSMSRNQMFWFGRDARSPSIRLRMNAGQLRRRYKVVPLDAEVVHRNTYRPGSPVKPDRHNSTDPDIQFSEEFVVGDIKGVHRYVSAVEVRGSFVNSAFYNMLADVKAWCDRFSINLEVSDKIKERSRALEDEWAEDDTIIGPLFEAKVLKIEDDRVIYQNPTLSDLVSLLDRCELRGVSNASSLFVGSAEIYVHGKICDLTNKYLGEPVLGKTQEDFNTTYFYNPTKNHFAKFQNEWVGRNAENWEGVETYLLAPTVCMCVKPKGIDQLSTPLFKRLMRNARQVRQEDAAPKDDVDYDDILKQLQEHVLTEAAGTYGFYQPSTDTEVITTRGEGIDHADYVAEHPEKFGLTADQISVIPHEDRIAWMAAIIDLTLERGWVRINSYRGAWAFQARDRKTLRAALREYDKQMMGIEEANCDVGEDAAHPDESFTLYPYDAVQHFIRTGNSNMRT